MSEQPKSDPALPEIEALKRRADRERRARQAAEKLLEQKSLEIFEANQALGEAQKLLQDQIETVQLERDRVVSMATIDPLTQLMNRGALFDHLAGELNAIARQKKKTSREIWFAVVLLKRFKRVNAQLGQIGGDVAIQTVGYRLSQCMDEKSGVIARYSGTEFAVSFSGTKAEFHAVLEQMCKALSAPFSVNGSELTIQFAIAAAGSLVAGKNIDALRTAVDSTISKIRRDDDHCLLVYDQDLHEETKHLRMLEKEVRHSVENEEFVCWFQPILFARDASAINLEALARWPKHGGVISPSQFIPIATDLGLWRHLEQQLFFSACSQSKPLVEIGLVQDVSFNVSPIQFIAPDFVKNLNEQLARIGFPADRLVLEITENALVDEPDLVARQIHALHELGVKIAVDDFGTGYSNLRNLIELPIDSVKIDRSLIKNLERDNRAAMLVGTLVQWARAINVSVVAEGVETETQAILLRALGCNRLQGFYFGRAMSAKRLEDRIPVLLQQGISPHSDVLGAHAA